MKITAEELAKINEYSKKELTAADVYVFKVALCNNDIDRDYEKFTIEALNQMAPMFKGRTGIFDHSFSATDQKMRVFDTYVQRVDGRTTKDGETFYELIAKVYMLRNKSNETLIEEIEAGIKKEVSVSCSMAKSVCSICGKDAKKEFCEHRRGKVYKDKLCFFTLEAPSDAYEFSFVAVPAQPEAGVRKSKVLEQRIKDGREYRNFFTPMAASPEKCAAYGYATIFNNSYVIAEDTEKGIVVTEEIAPTAFDNCDISDVIMQQDHNGAVFARTANKTLDVKVEGPGLLVGSQLGDTESGRKLYKNIQENRMTKMAYGFRVREGGDRITQIEHEDYTEIHREIFDIEKMFDVSAVSFPSDDATVISSRNFSNGAIAEVEAERLKRKKELEQREHRVQLLKIKIKLMEVKNGQH